MIEEVIADLFGVSQGTVSEIITEFTPLIAQCNRRVPARRGGGEADDPGRLALVDGTLWPCWSWEPAPRCGPGNTRPQAMAA